MTWMAQRDNAHFAKSLKVLVEFLLKLIGQVTGRKGHRMVSRVLLMLKVKTKSCTRTALPLLSPHHVWSVCYTCAFASTL